MSVKKKEAESIVQLYRIAAEMKKAGLSEDFIVKAVHLAEAYEGARDLFHLWDEEDDSQERDEIISDLQESIEDQDEWKRGSKIRKPLSNKDVDEMMKRVVDYKKNLRKKVDRWGGISKLAEQSGLPQPSLSRFFNTASLPRRSTLSRILSALGDDEEVDEILSHLELIK